MRKILLLERIRNGTVAGVKVNISCDRTEIDLAMAGSKDIKGSNIYNLIKRPLAPFSLRTTSTEKVGFSSVSSSIDIKKSGHVSNAIKLRNKSLSF